MSMRCDSQKARGEAQGRGAGELGLGGPLGPGESTASIDTQEEGQKVAEVKRMFREQMPHRAEKNACSSWGGQERPLSLTEKRGFSQDPRNKLASRCGWRKGRELPPEDKPEAKCQDSWTQNRATRATGRRGRQALGSGCQRKPHQRGLGCRAPRRGSLSFAGGSGRF